MTDTKLVQDEPKTPVVAPATPGEGTGSTGTPATSSVDAAVLQKQYEEKISKFEKDLDKMKSSLQKREFELTKEWQTKEAQLKAELEKYQVQNMDDDQRKAYEANRAAERARQLEENLIETQRRAEEANANLGAMQYFLAKGVPAQALVVDKGYEALWQSGMEWIDAEFSRLRTMSQTPPKPVAPQAPEPPEVTTVTGAAPRSGPTWAELAQKYGSEEEVYRLVESGQLPGSIIP